MGGLSALVDGAFAICMDMQFLENGECVFFGGDGGGTRELRISRNLNDSRDSSITFDSIDASGDHRTVKWNSAIACNDWRTLIFNSSGAGAGNLDLFVDGEEKAIASQTNDAGFNADEEFDLSFGEVEAGKIVPFRVTNIYVYNRVLTADEIAEITKGRYPSDYIRAYPFYFPNIGVDRSALTPVVD